MATTALNQEAQVVLEALKTQQKEMKTAEIAQITGIQKDKISKIISKLKKQGLVYSPKRCYYKAK